MAVLQRALQLYRDVYVKLNVKHIISVFKRTL